MKHQHINKLIVLLMFATAVYAWATPQERTESRVTAWEHLALPAKNATVVGDRRLATQINRLGDQGWELVEVSSSLEDGTTDMVIFYFKRPKRPGS